MTTSEFTYILVESFGHQSPAEFFRSRRKLWHKKESYSRKAFNEGLLKTFKFLNHQVNLPDRRRCQLELPDGQITDEFISGEERLQELKGKGKLSFPYQNIILVCREKDHKIILALDRNLMEELWKNLFRFLNPYCEGFCPPAPQLDKKDKIEFGGIIENIIVPEQVSRLFAPIEEEVYPENPDKTLVMLTESTQPPDLLRQVPPPANGKLEFKKAALILFYYGIVVTRGNCDEYARYFGQTSGEKLYQHYTSYSNSTDRRARLATDLKTKNKIRLFESELDYLSPEGKAAAQKDISILKQNMERD